MTGSPENGEKPPDDPLKIAERRDEALRRALNTPPQHRQKRKEKSNLPQAPIEGPQKKKSAP